MTGYCDMTTNGSRHLRVAIVGGGITGLLIAQGLKKVRPSPDHRPQARIFARH